MKCLLTLVAVLVAYYAISEVHCGITFVKQCYGQLCPQNTTYCLGKMNTTSDDLTIIKQINCLDSNFTVLATFNQTKENWFPEVSIEGYSVSNVRVVPVY